MLEHVELLGVIEVLHGGEPLLDRCQVLLRDAGERLHRAHGEPVRREAARHVGEERPQPADVGMEHDARGGMPSGRACTAGTSTVSSVSVTGSTDTSSSRPSLQVAHGRGSVPTDRSGVAVQDAALGDARRARP